MHRMMRGSQSRSGLRGEQEGLRRRLMSATYSPVVKRLALLLGTYRGKEIGKVQYVSDDEKGK
jgi:hypothetical protein